MTMVHRRLFFSLLASIAVGCAIVAHSSSVSYDEILQLLAQDSTVNFADLTIDLREDISDGAALLDLELYESQIELLSEQPLKLGPIGSAILDRFYFSLPGHVAMRDFYRHLKEEKSAYHDDRVELILTYMQGDGDGTLEKPFRAFTPSQAEIFVLESDYEIVGSTYDYTEEYELLLRITRSKESEESSEVTFELGQSMDFYVELLDLPPVSSPQLSHQRVIAWLARENDAAAQLSLALFYLRRNEYDYAIGWLTRSIRTGNKLAHAVLAEHYLQRARSYSENVNYISLARENLNEVIAMGHTPSMRQLGGLLVSGEFGEDAQTEGLTALERAVSHNDTLSMRHLASLYTEGEFVPQDFDKAEGLLIQAAELGSSEARIEYFQFLVNEQSNHTLNQRSVDWLLEEADASNPIAMFELGNCFARGCLARPNFRKARRWYRRAVEADPENAALINTVAWTLAVSHHRRLRDPRYAINLMDDLMDSDEEARTVPQYIDTWAAAYAAAGKFDRAVEIQKEALQIASNSRSFSPDDLTLMAEHLALFENREKVSEEIP